MAEIKHKDNLSKPESNVVASIELGKALGITSGLLQAAEIAQRVILAEASKSSDSVFVLELSTKIVDEIMKAAKNPQG